MKPKDVDSDSHSYSSMISEEFPLYQNTTFVQEGDTGNSDVDKFVGTNFCEVGTCYGVGESSNYNKINNLMPNINNNYQYCFYQ